MRPTKRKCTYILLFPEIKSHKFLITNHKDNNKYPNPRNNSRENTQIREIIRSKISKSEK